MTTQALLLTTQQARMVEKLCMLSQNPDIYMLLAQSLNQFICILEEGILLQLFRGTNKEVAKGSSSSSAAGGPRFRGNINVLMVLDPGVSKSQILQVSLWFFF